MHIQTSQTNQNAPNQSRLFLKTPYNGPIMHDVIIMVFIMVSLGHSTHPPSAMSIAFISISLLLSLLFVAMSSTKLSSLLLLLLLLPIFTSALVSVGTSGNSMAGADVGAHWSNAHPSRLAIDGKHIILYTRFRGRLDCRIKSSTLLVAFHISQIIDMIL
jgi:hypothetical protein